LIQAFNDGLTGAYVPPEETAMALKWLQLTWAEATPVERTRFKMEIG
jgi:hypothetical protein